MVGTSSVWFLFFVSAVIHDPLSPVPGRLKSGDLILDVNNISLIGVTNER